MENIFNMIVEGVEWLVLGVCYGVVDEEVFFLRFRILIEYYIVCELVDKCCGDELCGVVFVIIIYLVLLLMLCFEFYFLWIVSMICSRGEFVIEV